MNTLSPEQSPARVPQAVVGRLREDTSRNFRAAISLIEPEERDKVSHDIYVLHTHGAAIQAGEYRNNHRQGLAQGIAIENGIETLNRQLGLPQTDLTLRGLAYKTRDQWSSRYDKNNRCTYTGTGAALSELFANPAELVDLPPAPIDQTLQPSRARRAVEWILTKVTGVALKG